MDSIRLNKVSKLVQKELGDILQREFSHLYKGSLLTLTLVRVSPDLSVAKGYVSIYGAKNKKEILDLLNETVSEIRFSLGNKLRHQLRKIPDIHFYIDDSLDEVEKIERLLKK